MTHLLHPEDDKWQDIADVEHRRVDLDSHIKRWEGAVEAENMVNRSYLEKSDMGQYFPTRKSQ